MSVLNFRINVVTNSIFTVSQTVRPAPTKDGCSPSNSSRLVALEALFTSPQTSLETGLSPEALQEALSFVTNFTTDLTTFRAHDHATQALGVRTRGCSQ